MREKSVKILSDGCCCVMNSVVKTGNTVPIYLSVMWSAKQPSIVARSRSHSFSCSLALTHAHIHTYMLFLIVCSPSENVTSGKMCNERNCHPSKQYQHTRRHTQTHRIYLYPHFIVFRWIRTHTHTHIKAAAALYIFIHLECWWFVLRFVWLFSLSPHSITKSYVPDRSKETILPYFIGRSGRYVATGFLFFLHNTCKRGFKRNSFFPFE